MHNTFLLNMSIFKRQTPASLYKREQKANKFKIIKNGEIMANLVHGLWSGAAGALAGYCIDNTVQQVINPDDSSKVNPVPITEARREKNCCHKITDGLGFVFRKVIGPAITGFSAHCIASGRTYPYPSLHVKHLACIGCLIIVCGNALQRSARKTIQIYIKSPNPPAASISTEKAAWSQMDVKGKLKKSPKSSAATSPPTAEPNAKNNTVVQRRKGQPKHFTFGS
jgi:hypothetical protein